MLEYILSVNNLNDQIGLCYMTGTYPENISNSNENWERSRLLKFAPKKVQKACRLMGTDAESIKHLYIC